MHIVMAHDAMDFLTLVPQLVGFTPQNSLVLVAFRGARSCGALRFDLPSATDRNASKVVSITAVGMLGKIPAVDGVAFVVYTDVMADDALPHDGFVEMLRRRAGFCGLAVCDALCVASNGWGSYLEASHGRGRVHGLDELARSSAGVHRAELDPPELVSPEERAALPPASAEDVGRVAEEYERIDDVLAQASEQHVRALDHECGGIRDPVVLAECVLTWSPDSLDPASVALFCRVVVEPPARDVVLLTWGWGTAFGRYSQLLSEGHLAGDAPDPGVSGECALGGGGMQRPDPARIQRAITSLRAVASRAPGATAATVLTMLAWMHWALGLGSVAGLLVDRARTRSPGCGLAERLGTMVATGMVPEWVFDDPSVSASDGPRGGR